MLLIKLLGIILCTGLASCASVRMSMSAVDIPVGGELKITVVETAPKIASPDFNKLRCGFLPHGSTQLDALAEYDVRASRFDFPSEGQPSRFNGRISFEGNDTIKIGSIRFADKSTIFYCILVYYDGVDKLHVETMKHQIQHVYTMPAFTGGSSSQETIELIFGKPKTFDISVKSIPASNITCKIHDTTGVEFLPMKKSKVGEYFVTTQQMTIKNSTMNMDGKKIVCYGNPEFGRQIETKIFLKVKPDIATFIAPTPSSVVVLTKGENRTIYCTVKSRQASKVTWEVIGEKINAQETPTSQIHTGNHFLITSGIRIIEPSGDIGKWDSFLRCNGIPRHGQAIHQPIYLEVKDEKVLTSAQDDEAELTIYKRLTYVFSGCILLMITIIVAVVARFRRKYVMMKKP